jgi:hypothetical protein
MPTVMCTKDFWRVLGSPHPLNDPDDELGTKSSLGRWAAKAIGLPEGDVVVALNELTYLPVIFPLMPLPDLLAGFGYAVGRLLEDLEMPERVCRTEAQAFLSGTSFAKNGNRSLVGSLNDVCYHVDVALQDAGNADPDTLHATQLRLSRMPHSKLEWHFPDKAAQLLFADGARA